jgi:glycine cleavage system H protein
MVPSRRRRKLYSELLRWGILSAAMWHYPELGRKGPTPAMHVRYTQDHQYIIVEDGVGTVGITNHAQEKLSDVTTVELPHVGAQVQKGAAVGVIESVKAASDLCSPVSGEILGVNEALTGKPELVNEDAEGAGWIYKIKLVEPSELDALLDREAYLAYVREQG